MLLLQIIFVTKLLFPYIHSHSLYTGRATVLFRIKLQFTYEYYFKCGSHSTKL